MSLDRESPLSAPTARSYADFASSAPGWRALRGVGVLLSLLLAAWPAQVGYGGTAATPPGRSVDFPDTSSNCPGESGSSCYAFSFHPLAVPHSAARG
jgi:hypothetical protein